MGLDEIYRFDSNYRDLRHQWEGVRDAIRSSLEDRGLKSYSHITDAEDEIQFRICGVNCYVRFHHNLNIGSVEYGVLAPLDLLGKVVRKPLTRIELKRFFNQPKPRPFALQGEEIQAMHYKTLSEHLPAMVDAFFGNHQVDRSSD